jgi:O-methyltransferase
VIKRQVRSVLRRLVGENSAALPPLAPETRRAYRRLRMVFPPAFPERTAGLFALIRYLVDEGVEGDVVECGVGRGVSFFLLGSFMAKLQHRGLLFGFDSFQGFPTPSPLDASPRNPQGGEWAETSPEHVKAHFADAGLNDFFEERCRLIRGFFEQTLTGELPFTEISMLHLDVDLYESYRTSGSVLEPLVAGKGVVLVDEFNDPAWPGATKAVLEILRESTRTLFYSRLMNKHIAIEHSLWEEPTIPFLKLRADLQLAPAATVVRSKG